MSCPLQMIEKVRFQFDVFMGVVGVFNLTKITIIARISTFLGLSHWAKVGKMNDFRCVGALVRGWSCLRGGVVLLIAVGWVCRIRQLLFYVVSSSRSRCLPALKKNPLYTYYI